MTFEEERANEERLYELQEQEQLSSLERDKEECARLSQEIDALRQIVGRGIPIVPSRVVPGQFGNRYGGS